MSSSVLDTVEDFDLSDNNLGVVGIAALASGSLPNLRTLHLLRTRPQEEGVPFLLGAGFFPGLRSLSLGGNNLGPGAATWLANAPAENLRVLDLRENRLGDRGAISLAESKHLAGLIELDLAESRIADAGAEALADSEHLGGLIYLNMFGNPITEAGKDRLKLRFGNRVFL
jgi:hypothetical protein